MLELKIDIEDLRKGVQALRKEMPWEMADALDYAKNKFLKAWRAERLQGPPGVKARPSRGGGIFVKFQSEKIRNAAGESTGIRIATDSGIAEKQEKGGDVRGRGRGMAVPLFFQTKMFLPSPITGALRKTYADVKSLRRTFVIRSGGNDLIMRRKSKNVIEPLFVIKKSIQLKPRLGFGSTFDKMEPQLYGILASRVTKVLGKVWGGS